MPYTPTHDAIARVNPLKEFPSSVIVERALGRRKLGMGGPEGHCYMSAVRRVRSVSLRTHLFRCQPTYLLKACGTLKPTTCVSTKEEQKIDVRSLLTEALQSPCSSEQQRLLGIRVKLSWMFATAHGVFKLSFRLVNQSYGAFPFSSAFGSPINGTARRTAEMRADSKQGQSTITTGQTRRAFVGGDSEVDT